MIFYVKKIEITKLKSSLIKCTCFYASNQMYESNVRASNNFSKVIYFSFLWAAATLYLNIENEITIL